MITEIAVRQRHFIRSEADMRKRVEDQSADRTVIWLKTDVSIVVCAKMRISLSFQKLIIRADLEKDLKRRICQKI